MKPVKEAAGLNFMVSNDPIDRGGSRWLARGLACGLFLLEVSESSEPPLRSAFVPRPQLT
jgi:hypothetical protein